MSRFAGASIIAALVIVAACSDQPSTPTSPLFGAALAKAPPPPPAVDVTSTVSDADGAGNALITGSDDFNGTGSATYTAINNVTSHVTPDGSWQLYLGSQTARTLHLVLASQGIPIPDGNYSANVEAFSRCWDANNNLVSILVMAAGTSNGNCSFGVDFASGRTKYKLTMGPTFAGTGRAIVTCNAVAGSSCTNWTIVPNANAANDGVANLYHFAKNGSLILDGVYRQSYSVTVAR